MDNYQFCLIIPFEYNDEKFNLLANEKNGLISFFNKEKISSSGIRSFFNEKGENIFLEKVPSLQVVYKYKFDENNRQRLGIIHNTDYRYKFKKEEILFEIVEIYLWFFKSGGAYLTIRIKASNLSISQILKLNSQVNWMQFRFFYKKERDGKEENMSIGELVENCMVYMDKRLKMTKVGNLAYQLSYLLTSSLENEELSDFLERYRVGKTLESGSSMPIDESMFYKPEQYNYISWGVAKQRLVMHGDCSKTGKNNIRFMQSSLKKSIFSKYLLLYLYYIDLLQICNQVERQQEEMKKNNSFNTDLMSDIIGLEKTVPEVLDLENHKHINILFCQYLCKQPTWNLYHRLKEIHSHDVFISYRHDGGQYLALLLYYMLGSRGIEVFLDNKSLRSGSFDAQLVDAIAQSKRLIAIISPGSVERLKEKDDWVRKEIACALDKKVTIIPVVMENVKMPTKEELPEDIQELTDYHGIVNSSMAFFDKVVEELIRLIRK